MNSQQIQESVYTWASNRNFTAPYGVLSGSHVNSKGRKFLSVTFGYARTLDATVEIYNRNFILFRTNTHGSEVYTDYGELMSMLNNRY